MTTLYYGVTRAMGNDPNQVKYTSGSSNSTEIELTVDNTKSLNRKEVVLALDLLKQYFEDSSRSTFPNI